MRVDALEGLIQNIAAAPNRYTELKGLRGKVTANAVQSNDNIRYLQENNWSTMAIDEVLKYLNIPKNRSMIMKLLKRSDWIALIGLLDRSELLQALRYFDKMKLFNLLMFLPKGVLIHMLLTLWGIHGLMKKLPTRELFAILRSHELPMSEMIKGFAEMQPKFLIYILGKIFQRDLSGLKPSEMLSMLLQVKKRVVLDSMKFLPYKALTPLTEFFVHENPKLLMNMNDSFIAKLFQKLPMPSLMAACQVLDDETLVKLLSHLPDKELMGAASLADDSVLEQYLVGERSDLLALLGAQTAA